MMRFTLSFSLIETSRSLKHNSFTRSSVNHHFHRIFEPGVVYMLGFLDGRMTIQPFPVDKIARA